MLSQRLMINIQTNGDTPHGTSEVGFHHISNFNQRVNNGTLLTVAAMEQLLRAGGGRSAGSNAKCYSTLRIN